jgi:hypothetical protein
VKRRTTNKRGVFDGVGLTWQPLSRGKENTRQRGCLPSLSSKTLGKAELFFISLNFLHYYCSSFEKHSNLVIFKFTPINFANTPLNTLNNTYLHILIHYFIQF